MTENIGTKVCEDEKKPSNKKGCPLMAYIAVLLCFLFECTLCTDSCRPDADGLDKTQNKNKPNNDNDLEGYSLGEMDNTEVI